MIQSINVYNESTKWIKLVINHILLLAWCLCLIILSLTSLVTKRYFYLSPATWYMIYMIFRFTCLFIYIHLYSGIILLKKKKKLVYYILLIHENKNKLELIFFVYYWVNKFYLKHTKLRKHSYLSYLS